MVVIEQIRQSIFLMTEHEHYTDVALRPVPPNFNPLAQYAPSTRMWQGVPTIERTPAGRLWAAWYGGRRELNDNYVILATSGDDGGTWSDPLLVVDPPAPVRTGDPCLWLDPNGRLWCLWLQTCPMPGEAWDGRGGIWAITTDTPDDPCPSWTEPRRLSHGIAINKPIVTRDGTWLWPMSIWWFFEQIQNINHMRKPGVIASTDQGRTWQWRGGAVLDDRVFDEPMIVEKRDGTLWMLMRTRQGISESFSMDGGYSWSVGRPSRFGGPSSRFHFRRLASGRLLMINHLGNSDRKRTHLTAMLSEDDGETWPYRVLLDERERVSYPDAVEGPNGQLFIIYDHNRYSDREILMTVVHERDIIENALACARLKCLVSRGSDSLEREGKEHYVR